MNNNFAYSTNGTHNRYKTPITGVSYWDGHIYRQNQPPTVELLTQLAAKKDPRDYFSIYADKGTLTITNNPLFIYGELVASLIMIGDTEVYNAFERSKYKESITNDFLTHNYKPQF